MTIQEILDLGRMGYTKEDIEKMEEKKEPEKKEPEKKGPEKKEPVDEISQLTSTIKDLISTMQASNISKSINRSEDGESAEQILGNIIMPPLKKKGE